MSVAEQEGGALALQQVDTALGRISYRQAGQAERVHVLLHGIGSASGSWQAQLEAAQGRSDLRVLAWDAPGYGHSDPVAQAHPDADAYAQRFWAWLDALEVRGPLVLVGHSLGAIMAARAALQNRSRIERLLLLSPARGYGQAPEAERERVMANRLGQLAQLGPEGMARSRAAAMLCAQDRPDWVEQVRRQMAAIRPSGYTQAVHFLVGASLPPDLIRLRELKLPMVVASGQGDTVTTPQACDEVAAAAGVSRISLGQIGHACAIEAAQAVIHLMTQPPSEVL